MNEETKRPTTSDSETPEVKSRCAPASGSDSDWDKRFKSRRGMSDDEVLRMGDKVWIHGDWRDIPSAHIGMSVGVMAYIYGVNPRPTFGTRRKKLNDQALRRADKDA